ncbi:TlpA family protein disulfide reductase [Sinomicrobium pectinilyticum]|uniref:TlpA family protein disulfide reductase n=1 Tax=Sinomicrobium pectinilyticum TaxID=1084421 RepID=A0A3N0DQW4_SINP1|nr:TlpA disulfide reductase family protein [Sinomicrobium pectinilyticum]RNL78025.1 TlpA family protein disulfide reductase [Sinomicrobium pectinilyticum]
MKKTIYTLSGLVLFAVSCTKTPVDYAVVSGKIKNVEKELTLYSADMKFSKRLELREDGSFSDTIREKLGGHFTLGGLQLYLGKGSDIAINGDAADFQNTLAISGKGSAPSEYLILKRKTQADLMGKDPKLFFQQQEMEFKEANDRIRKTLTGALDSMKGGISEDFMKKEKRNLDYEYLQTLQEYENWHGYVTQNEDFKVSDGFLDELDDIDYNREEDYNFSQAYKEVLNRHYAEEAHKLVKQDSLPVAFAYLKALETISNEAIRNKMLFGAVRSSITYVDENEREEYYTAFKAASTDKDNNAEIEKMYNGLRALAKGNPSPGFTDYENYAGGTTSLDDLKGKYVYIDVWATWCGPCRAEIPFLKKAEEEYRDKNIEFVSISIDQEKDHDKWRAMIEEKELKGIQLLADNAFESEFVTAYLIAGIPHFILIDPEGTIVSSNAPRPSSPDLKKLFDRIL